MAASAWLVWPEAIANGHSDPEYNRLLHGQAIPNFQDANWADWRMFMEDYEDVLRGLGCGALLAYTTDGLPDEKIEWVSPEAMSAAADRLADLIRQQEPAVEELVAQYQDWSNRGDKPIAEQLVDDLAAVKRWAHWAQSLGKTQVAFELEV
jgi:hypothetical protein